MPPKRVALLDDALSLALSEPPRLQIENGHCRRLLHTEQLRASLPRSLRGRALLDEIQDFAAPLDRHDCCVQHLQR
jgi:hypothetical protein